MWRGDDQLLEEGRMIPSSIMWSNSRRAICRCSGDSRRALAETGGPVVVMWCVTLCLIASVEMLGWVMAGNSDTFAANGLDEFRGSSDGLGDATADTIPWMCNFVTVSTRRRGPKSTIRL